MCLNSTPKLRLKLNVCLFRSDILNLLACLGRSRRIPISSTWAFVSRTWEGHIHTCGQTRRPCVRTRPPCMQCHAHVQSVCACTAWVSFYYYFHFTKCIQWTPVKRTHVFTQWCSNIYLFFQAIVQTILPWLFQNTTVWKQWRKSIVLT